MLILRIEDTDGVGCYTPSWKEGAMYAHERGGCDLEMTGRHPSPSNDRTRVEGATLGHNNFCDAYDDVDRHHHPTIPDPGNRFGFASPEQYHRWFYTPKSRALLKTLGFSASLYGVPDECYIASEHQAVFALHRATLLTRMPTDVDSPTLRITWRQMWREYAEI